MVLKARITSSNALRNSRDAIAVDCLDTESFEKLYQLAFDLGFEHYTKACWILELVVLQKPELIFEKKAKFIENLTQFNNDSALRSLGKITYLLTEFHYKKPNKFCFDKIQLEQLAPIVLDWMISDYRVANKVYAMRILGYLNRDFPWISDALIPILEKDFPDSTPAYKIAAKDVIKKLKR